jgi:hypothetical protein
VAAEPLIPTRGRRFAAGLAGVVLALVCLVLAVAPALGAGWTSAHRVSPRNGSTLTSAHELASAGDTLHLVHTRTGPHKADDSVVYQRSGNGGASWTKESALWWSGSTYDAVIPNLAIAARGALVVAVFRVRGSHRAALFARVSHDDGTSFAPRVAIATVRSGRGLGVPAVAIGDANAILVAWTDRASHHVRIRRSTDGGKSFGGAVTVASSALSIDCTDPSVVDGLVGLAAAGSTIHVAWSEAHGGACIADRVRIRSSRDDGRTWGKPHLVTGTSTFGWPELSALRGRLLVSLQRPDGSLVLARSTDSGRTFRQQMFKAPAKRELGAADVALIEGGRAWLVYPDLAYHGVKVASSRLRFRMSDDSGRTWQPGTTIVSDATRLRQAPNLGAWHGKPVVLFGSGPVDGSFSDIWSLRAR